MQTSELKSKLNSSLDHLQAELSKIRTGRANPSIVEDLTVESYGTKMKIKELGSINVPDPQTIVISPWDKTLLNEVSKAVNNSDLGFNSVVDGDIVRIPVPQLTEDRRKDLAKIVSSKVEEVKQSIRNIRQDAMKDIDKDFNDKKISEDEKFTYKDDVEEVVKEFVTKAEEMGSDKKESILSL